jgi:hypothetical protein
MVNRVGNEVIRDFLFVYKVSVLGQRLCISYSSKVLEYNSQLKVPSQLLTTSGLVKGAPLKLLVAPMVLCVNVKTIPWEHFSPLLWLRIFPVRYYTTTVLSKLKNHVPSDSPNLVLSWSTVNFHASPHLSIPPSSCSTISPNFPPRFRTSSSFRSFMKLVTISSLTIVWLSGLFNALAIFASVLL